MNTVLLHPTLSGVVKLGSLTLARDKLYRALQYYARFYAFYLISRGDKESAAKWSALKTHLGTARKLLRLGKPIEHLQAALRATMEYSPFPEQITTVARQIAYFFYLSTDAFVWAHAIRFYTLKPETAQRIAKISNRFWLAGILFSLINGTVKSARLAKDVATLKSQKQHDLGNEISRETKLRSLTSARENTRHQLVMDSLDVWLPATALGLSNLNDGVLGIFGLITSIMALNKQWVAVSGKI
ncbi:peroxisomal biogenesis factor 11 [Mycena floridula]|nr:peroxisomal biogenesis factor 11 [Mycena floridula]